MFAAEHAAVVDALAAGDLVAYAEACAKWNEAVAEAIRDLPPEAEIQL